MYNMVFIGGMGSGKSTLAGTVLNQDQGIYYAYMGRFNVIVPLTLFTTDPNLLTLTKEEYLDTILRNENITPSLFQRHELDAYGRIVTVRYGPTILGEMGVEVSRKHGRTLLDNIPGKENIAFLIANGFYVVGLACRFDTQVARCLQRKKQMDPSKQDLLEQQIMETNEYFEIDETLQMADVVYDTDDMSIEGYQEIAKEILERRVNNIQSKV